MDSYLEEIFKTCGDGLSINFDQEWVIKTYYDYIGLFPMLAQTKYMVADEENGKCKQIVFFMENEVARFANDKFEIFPIKNRIKQISIDELEFYNSDTRKNISKLSLKLETDLGLVIELKEAGKRAKTEYLSKLLEGYLLPNLKQRIDQ